MTQSINNEAKQARAKANALLMEIDITRHTVGVINPNHWYVIYEDNLLKPKVLKYSFKSRFFANQYLTDKQFKAHRFNILRGSTLIEYGFDKVNPNSDRALIGKASSYRGINYAFPSELSRQRKKTLRTMYRRNYRRLMIKLLEHGKAKTKG